MNYFEILPDDLLFIILKYSDDNTIITFIDIFRDNINSFNNIGKLDYNFNLFRELIKIKFEGFYDIINSFYVKEKDQNNNWRDTFYQLIENIPDEEYLHLNKILKRSELNKNYILYTIGIVNYPSIIYEALFNLEFEELYLQLKDYDVPWNYIYQFFKIIYGEDDWYILGEDAFFIPFYSNILESNDNINILKVIMEREEIKKYFEDELIGNSLLLEIEKDGTFIKNFDEVVKFIFIEFIDNEILSIVDYIKYYIDELRKL